MNIPLKPLGPGALSGDNSLTIVSTSSTEKVSGSVIDPLTESCSAGQKIFPYTLPAPVFP
jgi:hypothetical protein